VASERLRDGVDERIELLDGVAVDPLDGEAAAAVETPGEPDEPVRVGGDWFVDGAMSSSTTWSSNVSTRVRMPTPPASRLPLSMAPRLAWMAP